MPKYEIPKFSYEELLAGAGYTPHADVIGAAQKGASLIDTVSQIKERKLKQQKEIEEIERKLEAQQLLAQTVEGKPEMERKKAALQPLAPKPQLTSPIQLFQKAEGPKTVEGKPALAPSREVMPMQPESPEYQKKLGEIQEEEKKRQFLSKGIESGLISPEKALSTLYPSSELTRANAPQILPFINSKTGERLTAMWDPATRQITAGDRVLDQTEWIRDYKPDIKTDPRTEELLRITSSGTTSPISPTGQREMIEFPEDLTVRQSNRLNELSKRFEDDEIVKSSRISLMTLQNLQTVQAQGTGALIGSLQSLRARGLAGEKGVLTEKDVERTTGSPQLARRFWNAFTKLATGQENPENIAEFKAALSAVEEAAAMRSKQVENEFIQRAVSTKELSNVSPELIRSNISIGATPFSPGPVVEPQYPGKTGGMTPEKKARLEELRAKKAAGTLR